MKTRRRSALIVLVVGGMIVLVLAGRWRNERQKESPRLRQNSRTASVEDTVKDLQRKESPDTSSPADARTGPTVERIRQMLGEMEPVLPGEVENATALELLRWWAELDPAAAIEFAGGNMRIHGRSTLPAELFIAWLDRNASEAMRWSERLPAGALRSQLLPTVISLLAQEQPIEALRMAGELSGDHRRAALSTLFSEWTARHPRAAASAALQLADEREQNLALRQVLGKWMDRDMSAAIAWAKELPPAPAPNSLEVLPPALEILFEKWAGRSPGEAAAYLLTMPESAGRTGLLRAVAAQWAGANPREALQWTAGVASESDRSVLLRGVLATVAESDARGAAELVLSFTGTGLGEPGLALVIDQWNARDAAGLPGWVSSLLDRVEARGKLAPVITTWAATDVNAAERWLTNVSPGDARDACCRAMSQYWAPRDRPRALEWAAKISDPGRRREGIDAVTRG